MKKIMMALFTLALLEGSALAITGRDNWNAIRKSHDVLVQQPTFAGAFGQNGLFNVCATEDEFRSIKPVRFCAEFRDMGNKGDEKDYECAEYVIRPVTISRTFIQNSCVKQSPMTDNSSGECLEYETYTSVYPTSFSLPVIDAGEEQYGSYLFSKTFAVPNCK